MTPEEIHLEYIISRYKQLLDLEKEHTDALNKIWSERFVLTDEYEKLRPNTCLAIDVNQGRV